MSAKTKQCPKCGTSIWDSAQQCRDCRNKEASKHGTLTAYRRGCRCDACITGARERRAQITQNSKKPCPGCGEPISSRSDRCLSCSNMAKPVDILRTINHDQARLADWRPPHYPPACPACNGFGYTQGSWSACPSCKAHPGHVMSHEEWTAQRA